MDNANHLEQYLVIFISITRDFSLYDAPSVLWTNPFISALPFLIVFKCTLNTDNWFELVECLQGIVLTENNLGNPPTAQSHWRCVDFSNHPVISQIQQACNMDGMFGVTVNLIISAVAIPMGCQFSASATTLLRLHSICFSWHRLPTDLGLTRSENKLLGSPFLRTTVGVLKNVGRPPWKINRHSRRPKTILMREGCRPACTWEGCGELEKGITSGEST